MSFSTNQSFPDQQGQNLNTPSVPRSTNVLEWGNSKFRAIFEGAAFGMMMLNLDEKIIETNLSLQQMLGYEESELYGISFTNLIFPTDSQTSFSFLEKLEINDYYHIEKRLVCKSSQIIWVRLTNSLIRNIDGSPNFIIGICEDITIQKNAEGIRYSAELLQIILNNIPQLIFWKDCNSVYLGCNYLFAQAMGLASPEEIIGKQDSDLPSLSFEDAEVYKEIDRRIMERDQPELGIVELQPNSDGKQMWVERNKIPIHSSTGDVIGVIGTLQDITTKKETEISLRNLVSDLQAVQQKLLEREEKLKYDAYHDSLTGMYNRFWLTSKLQKIMPQNNLYAVLFIDLDRFKVINDSLGHLLGDELLKQVSRRLQDSLADGYAVTRFGGDEFIILLEEIDDFNIATDIANYIQSQLRIPFKLNNREIYITASMGITFGKKSYQQPEEILRDADIAMYQAKTKGKGCYEVFNPQILTALMERLNLENDLRKAIANQEFYLDYQPLISLSDQSIYGFEALVRWQHPIQGIISPTQFIPIAEETGLINTLGLWIIQEACCQAQSWLQEFCESAPISISVNLSPIQLKQSDLGNQVAKILAQTGISAANLKLEITESCLLETDTTQLIVLNQLREMGVKLCIDDFGTGYSSLSRLHKFPIDTLKIDRSFVNSLNTESTQIVEMIIALAYGLGMNTVAEGIENYEQMDKLVRLGCHYGQGYLFSKPLNQVNSTKLISQSIRERIRKSRDH